MRSYARLWIAALFAVSLVQPVAQAESPVSDDQVVTLVDNQLSEWWLKPNERMFDQIGWAEDLRTAVKLSAEHQRPIFLFTMDGRVHTGRC